MHDWHYPTLVHETWIHVHCAFLHLPILIFHQRPHEKFCVHSILANDDPVQLIGVGFVNERKQLKLGRNITKISLYITEKVILVCALRYIMG